MMSVKKMEHHGPRSAPPGSGSAQEQDPDRPSHFSGVCLKDGEEKYTLKVLTADDGCWKLLKPN